MEGLSTGGREGGSIGEDPGGVGRGRERRGEKERGREALKENIFFECALEYIVRVICMGGW